MRTRSAPTTPLPRYSSQNIQVLRYAGSQGSHSLSSGLSGHMTWERWTSNLFHGDGYNIGYGWWSHDIGGHIFTPRQ